MAIPAPQGLQGPRGEGGSRGPEGPPGSDAQFTGAPAGGDLTGTYPAPTIADKAIGPEKIARLGVNKFSSPEVVPILIWKLVASHYLTDGNSEDLFVTTAHRDMVIVDAWAVRQDGENGERFLTWQLRNEGVEVTPALPFPKGSGQEWEAGDVIRAPRLRNRSLSAGDSLYVHVEAGPGALLEDARVELYVLAYPV